MRPLYILFILLAIIGAAFAGDNYGFSVDQNISTVELLTDGSAVIRYAITFTCRSGHDAIDIVDIGLPQNSYLLSSAKASIIPGVYIPRENDKAALIEGFTARAIKIGNTTITPTQLRHIEKSEYAPLGIGVQVPLGTELIKPGQQATLLFQITMHNYIYEGDQKDMASLRFKPTWFGSDFTYGKTLYQIHFIFPPGVTNQESVYHQNKPSFMEVIAPGTPQARVHFLYEVMGSPSSAPGEYGISFPAKYVTHLVKKPGFIQKLFAALIDNLVCICPILFFGGIITLSVITSRNRKMKYLPPQASVEGVGIKRGLTAVEAAILIEMPLDRVVTMILFGLLKKRVLKVTSTTRPVTLEKLPLPEGLTLHDYEKDYLAAIDGKGQFNRTNLRACMVSLIKSVNTKMRGFSRKETREYYRTIVSKAWEQVKGAQTPEALMGSWEENLEWTMLDRDYERRTSEIFAPYTVFYPVWWPYPSGGGGGTVSIPTGGGAGGQMSIPGADFAHGVATQLEGMAGGIMGDTGDFTSSVTSVTNPPPVYTSSGGGGGGGGGGGCACACACAGCACACAGGGR